LDPEGCGFNEGRPGISVDGEYIKAAVEFSKVMK
jgi:hypothetical protein